MLLQRLKRITAYTLILSITLSFMPSLAFAASAESEVKKEEAKTAETVTKDDVIEKTEDATTYDLGGGKQMTVLYGGEVRYLDDNGKLRDYDASLVKINEGEKSLKDLELKGYSVRNNKGDTMQYLPSRLSEDTPLLMENDKYNIKMTMSDETLRMLDVSSDILVSEEKLPDIYDDVAKRKVNAKYESSPLICKRKIYRHDVYKGGRASK